MTHCISRDAPVLVVLAAGLGRRFGGGKPLAGVGDTGKPLMYFSVMDAWRAGIRKLVLVVNSASVSAVEDRFLPLLPPDLDVSLALQRMEDLPPGCSAPSREKPWGTGHALWCARAAVSGSCVVINADDYYGPAACERMVAHFAESADWAMVSYPLSGTLSDFGAVNRGLCEVRAGYLHSIDECFSISKDKTGLSGELAGSRVRLDPGTPVSMNIWGFGPGVFDCLEHCLERFFEGIAAGSEDEYYLPRQVMASIGSGEARVRVYPGREHWLGITYREDLARLGEAFEGKG